MNASLAMRLSILAAAAVACYPIHAAEQTLYVATYQHIYVYTPGAFEPRLTIDHGVAGVTQIAVDKEGRRYAANFGIPTLQGGTYVYEGASVTEFERGHTSPFLTLTNSKFSNATGVAVDDFGDVFASYLYLNTVSVYLPGQAKPVFEFNKGVENPAQLVLRDWHLYVATESNSGVSSILRLPESDSLIITAPGDLPSGSLVYGGPFAVSDDGTVYVGGTATHEVGLEDFIDVFARGATKPSASLILNTGDNAADPPYVAISGDSLYASSPDINSVFEYSISKHLKLVRTITEGLDQPGPLAVDAAGNLYVANFTVNPARNWVTIYAPKETTPLQTVTMPDNDLGGISDILIAK